MSYILYSSHFLVSKVSQLALTSYSIYGLGRFSIMFLAAAVIQLTPFTMTLRRKHLINTPAFMALYGLQLVFASGVAFYELELWEGAPTNSGFLHGFVSGLAILLRMGPRFPMLRFIQDNKFLMWLTIGILVRWLLPLFHQQELPRELVVTSYGIKAAVVGIFIWKGFLRDRIQCKTQKLKVL